MLTKLNGLYENLGYFGLNEKLYNVNGPLSFDGDCRKLKKFRPKRRSMKQVANLGERVTIIPSYYACLVPNKFVSCFEIC